MFWSIAVAMTAVALAFVLPRLVLKRPATDGKSAIESNVAVHRSQLAELDRDFASGLLNEAQHCRARQDLERRLLDDMDGDAGEAVPATASMGAALAVGIALPVLALGLYALLGSPDALHREPAASLSATNAGGLPVPRSELVLHLERYPRDGRSWVLLARIEFDRDRFREAADAYQRAVDVSAKVARDPGVWCEYADALGMAQGGTLAGRPRELIAHALSLDANHAKALEMAGSAAYESNEFSAAAGLWRQLLAQLPVGATAHRELAIAIRQAEQAVARR